MNILTQYVEGPETCLYLPDQQATLEYVVVARLSPEEYEEKLNRGWRKFGLFLFRPVCAGCTQCRPLRIPTARFTPDRSQRRALKRNEDLQVCFNPPTVDAARLDLWRRYHKSQAQHKGWPGREGSYEDYAFNFLHNPVPSAEITLFEGEHLRAVLLADITPEVVSAIYHYHDPDARDRSLGTLAILQTIALAQRLGRPYVHLGYYVAGCSSMVYKARFRPYEILGTDGVWREPLAESSKEATT